MSKKKSYPNFPLGTCLVTNSAFSAFVNHRQVPAAAFEAHACLCPSLAMTAEQHLQRLQAFLARGCPIVTHLQLSARTPFVEVNHLTVVTDAARAATVLMLTCEWSHA